MHHLRALLILCLLSVFCSACSSSKSTRNNIAPYDTDFEKDEDESGGGDNAVLSAAEQFVAIQEALTLFDEKLYSAAGNAFSEFQRKYPSHFYAPLVEIKLADSYYYSADYKSAIERYEEFIRLRPRHEASAYARLQIANSYFAQYRGAVFDQEPLEQAEKEYQKVTAAAPDSDASRQALKMLEKCRELKQIHLSYLARFYKRQGLAKASKNRTRQLLIVTEEDEARSLVGQEVLEDISAEDRLAIKAQREARTKNEQTSRQAQTASSSRQFQRPLSQQLSDEDLRTKTTESTQETVPLRLSCSKNSEGYLLELVLPSRLQYTGPQQSGPQQSSLQQQAAAEWSIELEPRNKAVQLMPLLKPRPADACAALDVALTGFTLSIRLASESRYSSQLIYLDRPQRVLIHLAPAGN